MNTPLKVSGQSKRLRMIGILTLITLALDLASKQWARTSLDTEMHSYLGNFFVLEHSENTGAFLSLGAALSPQFRFWIFTVLIAIITFGVLFYIIKTKVLPDVQTAAYTLIVAGGFGNLVDRVMKESVTDFMNVGIGSLRTGIFNVADMAIMAGVFILMFLSFKKES